MLPLVLRSQSYTDLCILEVPLSGGIRGPKQVHVEHVRYAEA